LAYVSQFLKGIVPGLQVVISDDLCQPQTLQGLKKQFDSKLLILGACSQVRQAPYLWGEVDDAASCYYPMVIVDLLAEASATFGGDVAIERAKLLLLSQVKRMGAFDGIRQDNLKVRLSIPRYKVSRRQFLTAALPRYEIVPCIDSSKCRGVDKCGLCQGICTANAITFAQDMVVIDVDKCSGCGACIASCPHTAVYYPTFSVEALDNMLAGLLFDQGIDLEPRMIAFTCESCSSALDGDDSNIITYPASVLPFKVPCLAMVSPWLMLRAFDMGCQGLMLISGEEKCQRGARNVIWEASIEFVKAVLDSWKVGPERVGLFCVSRGNGKEVLEGLAKLAEEIARQGQTQFRTAQPPQPLGGALGLSALVKGMGCKIGGSLSGIVSAGAVPFGKLYLDGSKCTGCGLCVAGCPTNALTMVTGKDGASYQLLFKHSACVGCGKCVGACPESCLQLQRILELDKICTGASELFRDDMLSCSRCGEPVAPMSMMVHVKDKIQDLSSVLLGQLELCVRCKAETQCYRVGNNGIVPLSDLGVADLTHDQAGQDRSE